MYYFAGKPEPRIAFITAIVEKGVDHKTIRKAIQAGHLNMDWLVCVPLVVDDEKYKKWTPTPTRRIGRSHRYKENGDVLDS